MIINRGGARTQIASLGMSIVITSAALWLLMGCIALPTTPDPLLSSTVTLALTMAPTVKPSSATEQPLSAPTLTQLPLSTPPTSSSPTRTPTLLATLTAAEREGHIRDLLSTNGGCELPCWWGITPGESTWPDTERWLMSLGARTSSLLKPDGTIVHETGGFDFEESKIYNRVSFIERSGVVDGISIEAEAPLNPEGFQAAWQPYDPQQIIALNGQPSRVWVQSSSSSPVDPSNPRVGYGLWLFYDHLGFVLEYSGLTKDEPVYHICPSFKKPGDIASIKLFLQSSDNDRRLENTSQSYALYRTYFHSIEEAAGLSLEEFYALFAQTDQPPCFDTPKAVWP